MVLKIAYLDENRDNELLEDVADKVLDASQRAVIEMHRQINILKELNPNSALSLSFDYTDILDDISIIEECLDEQKNTDKD